MNAAGIVRDYNQEKNARARDNTALVNSYTSRDWKLRLVFRTKGYIGWQVQFRPRASMHKWDPIQTKRSDLNNTLASPKFWKLQKKATSRTSLKFWSLKSEVWTLKSEVWSFNRLPNSETLCVWLQEPMRIRLSHSRQISCVHNKASRLR